MSSSSYISSSSSSSPSSLWYSSSSSVNEYQFSINKINYLSEFKDLPSICNSEINKYKTVRHYGYFDSNYNDYANQFNSRGYGLSKTINNKGAIISNDASKLFSMADGYVGVVFNFPYSITNGIYDTVTGNKKFFLFGCNMGEGNNSTPGFSAYLTAYGIEYNFYSTAASCVFYDQTTTINENEDVFIEFTWNDRSRLTNQNNNNIIIKVNDNYVTGENIPINDDSLCDYNFCVLDTPYLNNGLCCIIKYLIIGGSINACEQYPASSSSSSSP